MRESDGSRLVLVLVAVASLAAAVVTVRAVEGSTVEPTNSTPVPSPAERAVSDVVAVRTGAAAGGVPTTTTPRREFAFTRAPAGGPAAGTGRRVTYSVDVEEATGVDVRSFANAVERTLGDERSWIADGTVSVQRVTDGEVNVVLATPATTDVLCRPLQTVGRFSCRQGRYVVINADRWNLATEEWPTGLDNYRAYVINHEFGHALGHGHAECAGPGEIAPIMQQQTKGLDGCHANPWPYPFGV